MSNTGAGYDTNEYRKEPRILLMDIETTPFVGYTWGKWQQNVIQFSEAWHLLCFAYKWLGEEEIHVVSQRQFTRAYKRNRRDDRQVAQAMHALMEEADIVIAHNGDKFDIKKCNARFAIHGLRRPEPFLTVDTLKVAKRSFDFGSNSLNDLGYFLDLGHKMPHTGFDLWLGCMAGEDDSWDLMEAYNQQDVVLLEKVYRYFLNGGWILNHPNLALISGHVDACPNCGSIDRMKRGFATTTAYRFQRYQCNDCGSYHRSYASEPGSRGTYR